MINNKVRFITTTAMIAALYTAMSFAIPALSFSQIQIRFAEILCLLPLISKKSIYGLVLGCFLTNLLGAMLGINLLGYLDAIIGTFATFIAAYMTYKFRNIRWFRLPILSSLMPVIFNGLIIGFELAFVFMPKNILLGTIINGSYVAIGEFVAVTIIGLFVYRMLEERKLIEKFKF
jgi:uncharacterized membrane protein